MTGEIAKRAFLSDLQPINAALDYASRGWPVFPCRWSGPARKSPLTGNGHLDATRDVAAILDWWKPWPQALIGIPTGKASGFVMLDVDIKSADQYGFDTLDELGVSILPNTPMAHTASGGLHLYFEPPEREVGCTVGAKGRGVGPGLDWRGTGGYVIAPSAGSGYWWDPHWNLDTVPLASVPASLLPSEPERSSAKTCPVRPSSGLSPYAERALDSACRRIIEATSGQQEITLNAECFAIGTLAGAGVIPADFGHRVLIWAARQIRNYDHQRPWRGRQIDAKVDRAFNDGMRQPRKVRRGR